MKSALMLVCFFAFGFTHAAENCGDDLRCYFSPDELRAALGDKASLEESFTADAADLFAAEDAEDEDEAHEEFAEGADQEFADHNATDANTKAPIWASFISKFKKCAPGCAPANYSTFGKRAKPSCHNTGRAVDVGAIVCGGVTHKAINRGRYEKMVNCMKGKMIVLYRNGKGVTSGHHDHAHFSNGCVLKGGKKYYGGDGELAL